MPTQFMGELRMAEGLAAVALRILIFTCAARTKSSAPNGLRSIGLSSGPVWRIPGERMKMDQDHHVPLSQPALGSGLKPGP